MNRLYLYVALSVILYSNLAYAQTMACTGYPKTFNGKPCASTTRYWDGQMGACGCGTGNTSPFSWQWTSGTAAGSPPIYGAGTWCGSGCGKCYLLTPTVVGASPDGTGAPNLTPLVVKVTNLCPPDGNAAWCSYDVNSYGYDAHFDLMDYNMDGLISSMGWNNPEVTYEQVPCSEDSANEWSCECANNGANITSSTSGSAPTSAPATAAPTQAATTKAPSTSAPTQAATTKAPATSAPTQAATTKAPATSAPATQAATTKAPATSAPTQAATTKAPATSAPATQAATTKAPSTSAPATQAATQAATSAPATSAPATQAASTSAPATSAPGSTEISFQINGGSNAWWVGFTVLSPAVSTIAKIEIMDSDQAIPTWTQMTYEGNPYWNMYSINPNGQMKAPLSLRFTATCGTVVTVNNIITTFQATTINTGVAL